MTKYHGEIPMFQTRLTSLEYSKFSVLLKCEECACVLRRLSSTVSFYLSYNNFTYPESKLLIGTLLFTCETLFISKYTRDEKNTIDYNFREVRLRVRFELRGYTRWNHIRRNARKMFCFFFDSAAILIFVRGRGLPIQPRLPY